MNKGFTLVEVLIVVAILGILAAIVLPEFQSHSQQAKDAAARDILRILRQQIEIYAARHNGVSPGYPGDNPDNPPTQLAFLLSMVKSNYISELPKNPFNELTTIRMIRNDESFPASQTGEYGWIYKPATKDFRIDWPGTDTDGIPYYDY